MSAPTLAPVRERPPPERPGRGGRRRGPSGSRVSPLFAVPAGLGLVLMLGYPTVGLLALAFTDSSLARPLREFSGFDNFTAAAESVAFPGSLGHSVLFAVLGAVLQVGLGLGVALLLRSRGRRFGVAGVLLVLPLVTPPVMVGVAWKLMLAPVGGALQGWWSALGVPGFNPLGSEVGAFTVLLLIDTWQWMPFAVLMLYTALLGVDGELLEAAALDGAGAWRSFVSVVLPAILPALLAVGLLKTVIGFKTFDLVVVVTEGGPGLATNLAPYEIYRTGLRGDFDMGQAAAQTVLFVLVVSVVTAALSWARHRAVRAVT